MKDPLEGGGLKLPAAIDDKTPLPKFGEPSQTAPADEEATPAEPAAEKPAGETPSESTPPAAETPSGDNKPEPQPQ